MRRSHLALLLLLTVPVLAADFSGTLRVRAENWRWFDTPDADDEYTFIGAQLRLAASRKLGSIQGTLELEAPVLWNLPDDAALAPPFGQLGLGGSYYAANDGDTSPMGLFVKQAFLKRGGLRVGRFEFIEGLEHMPADAQLAAVRRDRVAQRLLGNFVFSHVGRSVDGVQYDGRNWTVLAARPTAGVFQVHGGRSVDVDVLYGSWVRSSATSDARLFAIGYRDDRNVVKTDNRSAAARNADREPVEIATLGAHYLTKQVLLWGAAQFGEWGTLDHSAYAFDAELSAPLGAKTTLRAGWYRSSGDSNPADGDHGTFFQILPTPRLYARFPFYNGMNNNDLFVQAAFKPAAKWSLASEIHRLTLSSDRDLWYAGGGAFEKETFGYAGRPSSGNDDLATVLDLSANYTMNPATTVTFYVGTAFGGDVVESIFAGDKATYAYAEVLKRF